MSDSESEYRAGGATAVGDPKHDPKHRAKPAKRAKLAKSTCPAAGAKRKAKGEARAISKRARG